MPKDFLHLAGSVILERGILDDHSHSLSPASFDSDLVCAHDVCT